MTEDQIERAVERKFNMLDRRLMAGDVTQGQYNELAKCINAWAENEYRIARNGRLGAPKPQQPCDHGLFSDEANQLDLVEMFQDPTNGE